MVEAGRAREKLAELLGRLGVHFARVEPFQQAGNHVRGLMSDLPRKNCWTLAEYAGDPTSDRMQRLLERAFASLAARIMVLLLPVVSPSRPAHLILDRIKTTSSSKALYADLE